MLTHVHQNLFQKNYRSQTYRSKNLSFTLPSDTSEDFKITSNKFVESLSY